MLDVNLFDTNFAHSMSVDGLDSASRRLPKEIRYIRNQPSFRGITIFTDDMIFSQAVDQVKTDKKIAWCQESPAIKPHVHQNIHSVEHKFDYIMTCNLDKVNQNPAKYKYVPIACCWIKDNEIGMQEKTKQISHIFTCKTYTEGHVLRHIIAKNIQGCDLFGATTFNKLQPHKDYMFSIIVENCRHNGYFSEKIIDCLTQGCIPIYWGDPNIHSHFNMKGIITFSTIEDLRSLKIGKNYYNDNIGAVKENIEICKNKFLCCDDSLANAIKELI